MVVLDDGCWRLSSCKVSIFNTAWLQTGYDYRNCDSNVTYICCEVGGDCYIIKYICKNEYFNVLQKYVYIYIV